MSLSRKNFDLGIYDSDTGDTIVTEKVADMVTPSGERLVLAYGTAKRGRLVQLLFPYDQRRGTDPMGMHTHFFMNDLEPPRRVDDDTLAVWAARAGMTRSALVTLLRRKEPRP